MNGSRRFFAPRDWSRRTLLKGSGLAALAVAPGGALAKTAAMRGPLHSLDGGRLFHIEQTRINPDGAAEVVALTVNGRFPGPELRLREGELFRVALQNGLPDEPATVHWHGLLVPSAMDGVPGISQPPVPPGEFYVYEFPLVQSGTYWYHSHYELQEQRGLAGALIIEAKDEEGAYDRDYVLLLSDWLHSDPAAIIPQLRRSAGGMKTGEAKPADPGTKTTSMPADAAPDLSDVAYDAFLLNGRGAADPFVAVAKAGERIRFRLINGAASTFFRFGIDGHALTVTHADGQPVAPVEVESLLIGMGECYDLLVHVTASGSSTIRAEFRTAPARRSASSAPRTHRRRRIAGSRDGRGGRCGTASFTPAGRWSFRRRAAPMLNAPGVEQGLQLAGKFLVRIRFEKPGNLLLQPSVVQNRLAGIAGGEQHLDLRVQFLRRVGEFRSVHAAGKLDIGEQNIDVRVGEKLQRILRGLRLQTLQSQPVEHLHRHLAQLGLVLDDQDDLVRRTPRAAHPEVLPPAAPGRTAPAAGRASHMCLARPGCRC